MCDYSLHGLPNRLAVEGEGLVTYRFPTGSGGLAPPTDIASANRPNPRGECRRSWWSALKDWLDPQMELDQVPAVCIPPGAHLLMNHIPEELRRKSALQAVEDVTFVQLVPMITVFETASGSGMASRCFSRRLPRAFISRWSHWPPASREWRRSRNGFPIQLSTASWGKRSNQGWMSPERSSTGRWAMDGNASLTICMSAGAGLRASLYLRQF